MPKQVPVKTQYALMAVLTVLAVVVWLGFGRVASLISSSSGDSEGRNGGRDRALSVVVAITRQAANEASIEAVGTGRARRSVTLVPEAAGEIVALSVTSGDAVARGDIILELDRKDQELAFNLADSRVIEAQRLYDRSESLRQNRVNSQANVDDAKSVLDRAVFERDQAREELRKRTLVAPFGGVVGIPKVEEGDRVTIDSEIVTLDDRSELYIEFDIPELYLSRVKNGETIRARTLSFEDTVFIGRIDQIDSRIDPLSRTVMVRAVLPNEDDELRPGMAFSVDVVLPGDTYPVVPELALLWSQGTSFVWRVNDDAVEQVPVQIVKRLNSRILVDGALARGDYVVVEGVQRLKPGSKVSFAEPVDGSAPLTN